MNRWARIGLVVSNVGTVCVGLIPYFGLDAGYGSSIAFRSCAWAFAWGLAWLVFVAGAALSIWAPSST